MKVKLTCGLIVIIFILNAIFISWNNEFEADTPENNHQEISSDIPKPRSSGVFDWSTIEVISEPIKGQNISTGWSMGPDIAVENGKIYVVWIDNSSLYGSGNDYDIFFKFYNGINWSETQVISEPVPGQDINTQDSVGPQIAVENGKIYVVWTDYNNTNGAGTDGEIFYRCNLSGSGWEPIQVLSEPVPGLDFNTSTSSRGSIAVEYGKIYVVWADRNQTNGAGEDEDIFYKCNLTGSGWEPVQVISEPVPGKNFNNWGISFSIPDIAVENGNIFVIWNDYNDTNGAGTDSDIFYRCNLTGISWEPVQVLSEPVPGNNINTQDSYSPHIAVENGNIYVAWRDNNNTDNSGADNDIFYRCNLTSISWEPVQVLSEPVPGQNFNIASSVAPNIDVEYGKIYVVWTDDNNTNGAGTDGEIFYRCNLTGSGWEDTQVISEPVVGQNFNIEDSYYSDIAVENHKNHIVWLDQNDTNGAGTDWDVFYRWIQAPFLPLWLRSPIVTPLLGNTSTEFNFTVTYIQLNNTLPSRMKVIIDGVEHSMLEVNPMDTNYTNGKKYYFKIKNLDIGTHSYEFNASDGVNYINTKVFSNLKIFNTAPQIIIKNNLTAIEDKYYEVNYEYEDIDIANIGQVCHWEFKTNASWLNFNTVAGELYGTPGNDDVGKYWVYIAVNDTIEIVFTNFTLKVLDINDDPIIDTPNMKQTNEDEIYEVDYNAIDIDSPIRHQIWSLETNASSWLNISPSSGILNGTPTNDEVGEYWVNVTINDTEGGTDFTNYTLTVLNVNDNPIIITEDITTAETDKLYEIQYNATDIDSPILKFSWSLKTNATWLTIDPSTGVLSGTPTRDDAGLYVVNVTVSDGDGGTDWQEFILTIYKGNLPPMITTKDEETARVDKSYEVDYNATDDRTHPNFLSWTLETNGSWLSIDQTTGILRGTPTSSDGGKQYWVNVSVYDLEFGFDYHNFTLNVKKGPKVKNNIPSLMNFKMTPYEGDTETEFTFTVSYFDEDNEKPTNIQVVIEGDAYNMELKAGETAYNGEYEYKTKLSEGNHLYYFTASDGKDANTSVTFTTPNIQKPTKVDGDGTEKEDIAWEMLILIIIIIIVIVLVILFMLIRKKKEEQVSVPPSQPEIQEPVVEQVIPPIPPEIPPPYPEYETGEPVIQDDLYIAPLEEQTIVTTMPDYTTPVQQDYELFEQPAQAQEEVGIEELEE